MSPNELMDPMNFGEKKSRSIYFIQIDMKNCRDFDDFAKM